MAGECTKLPYNDNAKQDHKEKWKLSPVCNIQCKLCATTDVSSGNNNVH